MIDNHCNNCHGYYMIPVHIIGYPYNTVNGTLSYTSKGITFYNPLTHPKKNAFL